MRARLRRRIYPSLIKYQHAADNHTLRYRAIAERSLPGLCALVLLGTGLVQGQSVTVTAAPGNINLFYLQGATLPATQNVTVKASGPATYTTAIHPTGTTTTALWLT